MRTSWQPPSPQVGCRHAGAKAKEGVVAAEPSGPPERDRCRVAWWAPARTAWRVGGAGCVLAARGRGLVGGLGFSESRVPAYAGVLALVVISVVAVSRAILRRRSWRQAFPPGYGSVGVATAVLVGYFLADLAWRVLFGIGDGIEAGLAPSRLILPIGLVLLAAGPV